MTDEEKKVAVRFFKTATGREPVREWLQSLDREIRFLIGEDIKTVEFGWPLGMPLCKNLKQGLWEVRTDLPDGIARVMFCIHEGEMVLLHGFIKKSQQTPKADLDKARKRKRDLEKEQ